MKKLILLPFFMVVILFGTAFCYEEKSEQVGFEETYTVISENPEKEFDDYSGVMQYYSSFKQLEKGKYKYTIHAKCDVSREDYAKYQTKLDCIVSLTKGHTDEEKVRIINDWIQENVSYKSGYTAYDAIMNGDAICEGYAMAFQVIAEKAGLKSKVIPGFAKDEGHAWNIVKIDKKWYGVDTCWNEILQGEEFNKLHEPLGDYKYKLSKNNF